MKAKKLSRRKRILLATAMTLPFIFGFSTVKAAPEVDKPFEETPSVETPSVETPAVETPAVETPSVETPSVETPTTENQTEVSITDPELETPETDPKLETPLVAPNPEPPISDPKPEIPVVDTQIEVPIEETASETPKSDTATDAPKSDTTAETSNSDTQAETPKETPDDGTRKIEINEPPPYRSQVDTTLLDYFKQFEGKTIVDIEFEGASSFTLPTVKAAVLENVGDTFTGAAALRDRNALMNTGYFYEAYQTFETVPEGIVITFHVMENPVLTDYFFTGNTIYTKEELDGFMKIKRGEILNSNTLHDNLAAIREDYHSEGFIRMKVTDMNMDNDGVLSIKINEGILEGYVVKGNKKTKEKVILREMRQKEGTPFNAKLARRSMQRVYNLGFFEDVNVKMNPGVEPNAVIMEIDVKEKRTGTFGIGAGYSTSDGIIGMVSISDTNFRGTGDSIALIYERSGDENDAQGYNFTYKHPWMDSHETALRFQIYNRTYAYNDYNVDGDFLEEYMRKYSGGEFTLSRPVSEYSTNYITFRHRRDRYVRHVSSGDAGNRSTWDYHDWRKKNFGLTRSIILEHVTDTRDNIYMPTEGNKVDLSLELGGLLGGDFDFQKASLDHQFYTQAGDHNQIWALRGMIGYAHGELTEFNQFRLGGQGSIRGYRDDQFRGSRMLLGTVEYRFPLSKKIQGAVFADWGAAWSSGFKPKNSNGSVGFGVALNTPMGPLRLDYGRGRQGGRFHFSVGTSF